MCALGTSQPSIEIPTLLALLNVWPLVLLQLRPSSLPISCACKLNYTSHGVHSRVAKLKTQNTALLRPSCHAEPCGPVRPPAAEPHPTQVTLRPQLVRSDLRAQRSELRPR